MQYKKAALGGTFDRLHKGHEVFLKHGIKVAEEAVIGVTKKGMSEEKELSELILPYSQRLEELKKFINREKLDGRVEIIELVDEAGPLLADKSIETIVATQITKSGAEKVNKLRLGAGLDALPIEICSLIESEDGEYLSSTRIRKGEVNRDGKVYLNKLANDTRVLGKFRNFLQHPHGKIFEDVVKNDVEKFLKEFASVVLVGDVALDYFLKNDIKFDIGVFDYKVKRKKRVLFEKSKLPYSTEEVKNPNGMITMELVEVLKNAVKTGSRCIKVKGEEDLAAPVLVLLLPLESAVVYGVSNKGLGVMRVTEKMKNRIFNYF